MPRSSDTDNGGIEGIGTTGGVDDGARLAAGESRVCVLGLGQVGLPAALLLAETYDVLGVDVDPERVAALNEGRLPFEEPGLSELFESVEGNFSARETVVPADAYVIVTPTPLAKRVGVADLDSVRAAGEAAGSALGPGELVVLESTVPPGHDRAPAGTDPRRRERAGSRGVRAGTLSRTSDPRRFPRGDAKQRPSDRRDRRTFGQGGRALYDRSPRARSIRRRRRPPSW